MRHRNKKNNLGRTASHRSAMMSNLATALILHKRITTTVAKAKVLKKFIEPIITRSKEDNTHNRRICFSMLSDKKAIAELFREISPKIAERPGGYTRILKTGSRAGDNAEMCIIELVDYNQVMLGGKDEKAGKTTRRRRSSSKKKAGTEVEKTAAAVTEKAATAEAEKTESPEADAPPKAKKASKPKAEKAQDADAPAKPKAAKPKANKDDSSSDKKEE